MQGQGCMVHFQDFIVQVLECLNSMSSSVRVGIAFQQHNTLWQLYSAFNLNASFSLSCTISL
jgi:hypothetical protein